jgi:NADPH:quinone reductase-like Zn-dependent oxidoreductase
MPLAMAIHRFGLANLRSESRAAEPLGPGLVRVAVRAVSFNNRDVLVIRGAYGEGVPLPLIPCSDGAGVVLEVGVGITDLQPGSRVCTHMVPDWREGRLEPWMRLTTLGGPAQGVLCEERVLPRAALLPIPDRVAFEHAACLPVAGLAAWRALTTEAAIGPGSRVLLLGTGGLSMLGLQIAKALGAGVAVVSSSDDKLERVRRLGADFTANYSRTGWGEMVRGWSGGGVDVVLEIGGDGSLEQSLTATRDGGCVALLGVREGGTRLASLADVLTRRIRVQGVFVGSRLDLESYLRFVETHAIEPIIDRAFEGLPTARHALAYLLTGRHLGKVVLRVSG